MAVPPPAGLSPDGAHGTRRYGAGVLHVILLCLPIFAVIGLGFAAVRRRIVPPVMIEAVGAFAFTFALPAMLFRLMASQKLAEIVDARFLAAYLACCLATFGGVVAASAAAGVRPRRRAAAFGTAAAFGNVGYLGPPLLLPLLGDRVSGPIAMAIMAEVAVILMLGDALMGRPGTRDGGPVGRALRALARNPVILSILAGSAVGALGLSLPDPVERFLAFLGAAAGPTALFALGGTLGGLMFRRRLLATAFAISVGKLVLYPALTWGALHGVLRLDPVWVAAGVLMASMPIASNAFILAQRHAVAQDEVSAAVMLSTVLAVAAFPATAWLLGVG